MTYPPALLTYAVTPTTVPYTADPAAPSVVTLMLTATNETRRAVDCSQLSFTLHVGADGGDLASTASGIDPSAAFGTAWTISGDSAGTFTAVPQAGSATLAPGDSLAFFLAGVHVNGLAASGQIDVWEQTGEVRSAPPLAVAKTPPGLAITSLTASPVQVLPGGTAVIVWTTTGADSCTLSWPGGSEQVDPAGHYPVTPDTSSDFTLTASGGGHSVSEWLRIAVPDIQILSFAADPPDVAQYGASTLSWRVANAASCRIQPHDVPADARGGTYVVNPADTTTYTLEATAADSTISMPTVVNVMPASIDSFTVAPSTPLWPGDPITLAWATSWATGCLLDGAAVATSGSVPGAVGNVDTHTLTAQGLQPPTSSLVVSSLPTFQALQILPGDPLTIAWTAVADSVNGGTPTGSMPVSGGNPFNASVELVAVRGGQASRIVIDLSGRVQVHIPIGDMTVTPNWPGTTLVPGLTLAAPTGLNRPGGNVSVAGHQSQYAVDFQVAGWGMQADAPGNDVSMGFQLGSPAAGEPWQVRCDAEIDQGPAEVSLAVNVTVFPLQPA